MRMHSADYSVARYLSVRPSVHLSRRYCVETSKHIIKLFHHHHRYHHQFIRLGDHSKSLEMTPFDRSHTSSYSSTSVTMAVSCTVFEIKRDIGR